MANKKKVVVQEPKKKDYFKYVIIQLNRRQGTHEKEHRIYNRSISTTNCRC